MIICDSGGLIAAYDQADPDGPAVRELLDAEAGALVVSPFVVAEVDYLLLSRSGVQAEFALLDDLADGVYQVAEFTAADAKCAAALARKYTDLKLGIADAHTMCLARPERYATRRILTFDDRHFRAVKPPQGGVFTILPTDLSVTCRDGVAAGWESVRDTDQPTSILARCPPVAHGRRPHAARSRTAP